MFKKNHPNYFYTTDGIRIFHNTNFSRENLDPTRPVLVLIYLRGVFFSISLSPLLPPFFL